MRYEEIKGSWYRDTSAPERTLLTFDLVTIAENGDIEFKISKSFNDSKGIRFAKLSGNIAPYGEKYRAVYTYHTCQSAKVSEILDIWKQSGQLFITYESGETVGYQAAPRGFDVIPDTILEDDNCRIITSVSNKNSRKPASSKK
nr:hypothetical protein BdHM001_18280 [Bdellovibrio sp. HM001]